MNVASLIGGGIGLVALGMGLKSSLYTGILRSTANCRSACVMQFCS